MVGRIENKYLELVWKKVVKYLELVWKKMVVP
jgi:hypothetical protein